MRRAVPAVAAACLLAASTVLAFFSGGFYAESRVLAAIVLWLLVLLVAITAPAPLPRGRAGRAAVGALAFLAGWSAFSLTWAPLGGPAADSAQRLVLYLGAMLLAVGVLRTRRSRLAVEPALAAGATVVIGYGLAGRLLPGIVELARSQSAGGRLEQPITYWNGEGALAAIGLILCARLAGDRRRPPALRTLAAAAAVPLGAGVYLSYSRGAIAVAVLGLVTLVAVAPSRSQLRAAAIALAAGAAAAAIAAAFPGVAGLEGSQRSRDGAIVLALLLLLAAGAALLTTRDHKPDAGLPWAPRPGPAIAALVAAAAVALVVGGLSERPTRAELSAGAGAARLTTVSSNRYEYWRVGLEAVADQPLNGLGAGGFRVFWLQERAIPEVVRDVHSLELELAAELGLVGLIALVVLVAGVVLAARRSLAHDRAMAAGWCAALLAWFLHASIDWDWQLPAVTLPAVVLAGALLALAEPP